jgi:hypothetical protein
MNWKRMDERPAPGIIVGVLFQHWKQHNPLSYQIMFGIVSHGEGGQWRADPMDYTGQGGWAVYSSPSTEVDRDVGIAWFHADLFNFPNFS